MLTRRTKELIPKCFRPEDQAEATRMLSAYRPHWPREQERAEIATLKYAQGSLERLARAIDQGEHDLRDLWLWVDFAHDTTAHLYWIPDETNK